MRDEISPWIYFFPEQQAQHAPFFTGAPQHSQQHDSQQPFIV